MSEQGPEMKITFGGNEEFLATPENTALYEHIALYGIYNHIFMTRERNGNRAIGSYVRPFDEAYEKMRNYMIEANYPLHLNIREATPNDIANYDNTITAMASDIETIPDWL